MKITVTVEVTKYRKIGIFKALKPLLMFFEAQSCWRVHLYGTVSQILDAILEDN